MKTGYEDALSEYQTNCVQLCLEYAEGNAEEIFIYMYRTETLRMFNVFFKSKGNIVSANQLDTSCSDDELLEVGRNDISELEHICREYEVETPNEIKIHYDVSSRKMDATISYEDYSIKDKVTPFEVFIKWYKYERSRQ